MSRKNSKILYLLSGAVVALLLLAFLQIWASRDRGSIVEILVPEFSIAARQGERLFRGNCMECHGINAGGTDKGPPLMHNIYNPGHHGDDAFYRAVAKGVVQHHWPFGHMPAQSHVSEDEVAKIVTYVRELQRANGIVYERHSM